MFFRRFNHHRSSRRIGLIATGGSGIAAIYYYTHLEKTPITGRRRFISISKEKEERMSIISLNNILRENFPLLKKSSRVERVVKRLLEGIDPSWNLKGNWDWSVHLIDDDNEMNAFVLPGGQIFVYTGLLSLCADDSSLATILGHEIGHALVRHGAEKMSLLFFTETIFSIAYQLLGGGTNAEWIFFSLLKDVLITLPFSRKCESEADWIGIQLMKRASYDTQKAIDVWKAMSSTSSNIPKILSTHPSNDERIKKIEEWIKEL